MMDKTELLFHMMEQPEKYDDQQWREILSDKDLHELYTMMMATRSAIDAERYDQQNDDSIIQQEWERFVAKHPHAGTSSIRPIWRRVAAVLAVIVIAVGIVVAAVHTRGFGLLHEQENSDHDGNRVPVSTTIGAPSDDSQTQEEISTQQDEAQLYDDVPLEQIMGDIASRYGVQVEWQSNEARSLRLYYHWEPSYTLDKVVDMLNSFQSFSIRRTGNKLIISDITNGQ